MKSIEEQMKEISRRKKRYENARKSMVFAMAGAGLLVALTAVVSIAPGAASVSGQSKTTVLGSTILDAFRSQHVQKCGPCSIDRFYFGRVCDAILQAVPCEQIRP